MAMFENGFPWAAILDISILDIACGHVDVAIVECRTTTSFESFSIRISQLMEFVTDWICDYYLPQNVFIHSWVELELNIGGFQFDILEIFNFQQI